MATLEKIRSRGGLFVAVFIGFALFAFIATDFFKGAQAGQQHQIIGEVNGDDVTIDEYNSIYAQVEANALSNTNRNVPQGTPLTDMEKQQVQQATWERIKSTRVLDPLYDNLGIDVSPEEIVDMFTGTNLDPNVVRSFTDPSTGQFNSEMARNFLINRNADTTTMRQWQQFSKGLIEQGRYEKFINLFSKSEIATDNEVNYLVDANKKKVDFDFVAVNYNTIPDSTIEVTRSEVSKYLEDHKESFKQEAQRNIEYVVYEVTPSDQDAIDTKKRLVDSKTNFASDRVNIESYLKQNSDENYTDTYVTYDMVDDSLKNFSRDAKIGDIYGPYLEDNAYKLTKMVDVAYRPDSVRARHILLNAGTYETVNAEADSLIQVIKNGGDFAALARQYSTDQGSAINGGDLNWFKEGMMVKAFNDSCFAAKPGDIIKVESQFGVHIINVQNVGAKVKKYKLGTLAYNINYSSTTYNKKFTEASELAAKNSTSDMFLASIKENNLTPRYATLGRNDLNVSGLDNSRSLVQWAFTAEVGDMCPNLYEFGNKIVIATVTGATEQGYATVDDEAVYNAIKAIIIRQKKAEQIMASVNKEKESSQSLSSLANKLNSRVQSATSVNFNSTTVVGAGNEPALIGLATSSKTGEISIPVEGREAVYIVKVTSDTDESNFDKNQAKTSVEQTGQYKMTNMLIQSIVDEAEVVDNRYMFM